MLTQPKDPCSNGGLDNAEANLICSVGDALEALGAAAGPGAGGPPQAFTVLDLLGQGTFGQVFKCQTAPAATAQQGRAGAGGAATVAVKVVKNKPVSLCAVFWGLGL